jgi:Histidine kinase-, DNA gyrase B-, and HSP90-like ATPase
MTSPIELPIREPLDQVTDSWSEDAPRGGRAVMNRMIKESATVPLFFAQTLIQSLRDVGYNHTTSALCEHVDNAYQAGANEIRIFFRQANKRDGGALDVAVYDNGKGMSPAVLKAATAFGGSLNFGNREGIGRFGMGMKTAALSLSPVMELYSWQEPKAIYSMTLDIDAIGRDRSNMVELPDATLNGEFTADQASLFTSWMSFPSDHGEQALLATNEENLYEKLGGSGTLVYMPACDRLTYVKPKTLVEHAMKEMARVYRRQIADGLKLYINNRLVDAFDPTYSMPNARHARFLDAEPKTSRLAVAKTVKIRLNETLPETAPVEIKIYKLPIEEWTSLPRKTQKNDLRIFDGLTVSILRNGREVFAGSMPRITTRHSVTHWYRVQIDFPGLLDEAFGVASNKQGVRLKGYVEDAIKEAIGGDITQMNDAVREFQAAQNARKAPAKPSTSEQKAAESDAFQAKELAPLTELEQQQMDGNLRGIAATLKRSGETEEQAFERIKASKYIIDFKHDSYWPFYDVTHKFGRVILTINTAHAFFTELYEPVSKLGIAASEDEDGLPPANAEQHGPTVALDLLLLSLARTQSRLSKTSDEANKLIDTMRREWSDAYRVQLS